MFLLSKTTKKSTGLVQSLYYGILVDEYKKESFYWEFLKIYLRSKYKK
jgi:hypothetical protein